MQIEQCNRTQGRKHNTHTCLCCFSNERLHAWFERGTHENTTNILFEHVVQLMQPNTVLSIDAAQYLGGRQRPVFPFYDSTGGVKALPCSWFLFLFSSQTLLVFDLFVSLPLSVSPSASSVLFERVSV